MSSIQSISAGSNFSTNAVQGTGRARRSHDHSEISQATLVQDLTQSGLKAGVTPDQLLSSIQSSIQTALNDPKNVGTDPSSVIQGAVTQTLQDNGVDTSKLAALLQTQSGGSSSSGQASHAHHGHHGGGAQASGGNDPDRDGDVHQLPPPSSLAPLATTSANSSSSTSSTSAASASASSGATSNSTAFASKSHFDRLVYELIKSLPSGSAINVQA